MKFGGGSCLIALFLGFAPALAQTSPAPAFVADRTVPHEIFIKQFCAAIHSMSFDDEGNMWVGCLGDTPADLHKPGAKKIYRITPDKKAQLMAQVDCTYITAVRKGPGERLFVATEGPVQLLSISKDGKQEKLSGHGTYYFELPGDGTVRFFGDKKIWSIGGDGKIVPILETDGLWDTARHVVYRSEYSGRGIMRRAVRPDNSLGPEEVIADLPFVKGLVRDPDGTWWGYGYDQGNYLVKIKQDKVVERIRVEAIPDVPEKDLPHFLNTMVLGKGAFGPDTIYFTTWAGDIVKVKP